jgi:hypothetical protein
LASLGVSIRRPHLENEPTRRSNLSVNVDLSRRVTDAHALSAALLCHPEYPATADYAPLEGPGVLIVIDQRPHKQLVAQDATAAQFVGRVGYHDSELGYRSIRRCRR